jgi:uncharacterized protein (TIGR01777 family)
VRVALTGATGLIGRALVRALGARGDEVTALVRDKKRAQQALEATVSLHEWREPQSGPPPTEALRRADVVVNLMGEPIAQRWSETAKRRIRDSRVLGTRMLAEGIGTLPDGERPTVLVSQSATGFYGASGDQPLDESAPPGSDFLARVVVEWEREANAANAICRVVTTRTGVVLAASGGALAQMLPFFRLGLGGPVAGGRQYIPWVHLDDLVGAILHCIGSREAAGAVNLTAPDPVTNAEFSRALGRVLQRPAVLPVPAFGLRLLYGEMAQVVATGQRVVPARLARFGYEFRHTEIEAALRDALGRR